jgi:quinoprotein glucose dehydrogenase
MLLRLWLVLTVVLVGRSAFSASGPDWPVYGGEDGQKYSPLAQITPRNVSQLTIAWSFHTGDAYQPKHGRSAAFEDTPLYIDQTLFVATPLGHVYALNPTTGQVRWSYDTKVNRDAGFGDFATRGLSTWVGPEGRRRLYFATVDARLIALDATTGKPCADFGDNGVIDLRHGLRVPVRDYSSYEETSPPAIAGATVIVGSGIADNSSVSQPSGEVRGFDARTGKLKWTWDPVPQDSRAPGAETWQAGSARRTGAANAWSVIVADEQRGLIFVPTGSPSPDYYGGERKGSNLFANSLIALHADTGKMAWAFQTVHHDLWDYDVASPPVLFDVRRNGKTIPAVAVGSKTGNLFILNRETGKPIFGVEERPVPQTDVTGEQTSPTQPFPLAPKNLVPQAKVTSGEAWGFDDQDRAWCRAELAKLRSDGIFTPPSVAGSLLIPGNVGGMAWGGEAFDPKHRLLIFPVNNLPVQMRLIPRAQFKEEAERGRQLGGDWEFAPQLGTPFGIARRILTTAKHVPCTAPPWGMLTAVEVDTGKRRWQVPVGQLPWLSQVPGSEKWGSLVLGGPLVTGGGLVFMGGTLDAAIRAFDVVQGRELWKATLPASARSNPMTFMGPDGKQYVIIAAGGHGLEGTPSSDALVAFRLP